MKVVMRLYILRWCFIYSCAIHVVSGFAVQFMSEYRSVLLDHWISTVYPIWNKEHVRKESDIRFSPLKWEKWSLHFVRWNVSWSVLSYKGRERKEIWFQNNQNVIKKLYIFIYWNACVGNVFYLCRAVLQYES